MEKQRVDSLKVVEFILAEDIADHIDENDVGDSSTVEEVDSKMRRVEQLRTSCRSCTMSSRSPYKIDMMKRI